MRHLHAILIAATLLSSTGCASISKSLIRAIFDSQRSKKGTSDEPGISQEERKARWEAEFHREMRKKWARRSKPSTPPDAPWEQSIDRAFSSP